MILKDFSKTLNKLMVMFFLEGFKKLNYSVLRKKNKWLGKVVLALILGSAATDTWLIYKISIS